MKAKPYTKLHQWRSTAVKSDQTCAKCKRVGLMTVDHIVPLNFIEMLGMVRESYDDDWNYQYLCRACNVLKGSRMDFNNPQTFVNLDRYVEKARLFYNNN